ncbi:MAG: hypothetical protein ACFE8J_16190, partial [Candidatus Heimdallarchaeota archaeon]
MVEANLKGMGTKNCVNCVNIEAVIQECISEERESKARVAKTDDKKIFQEKGKSRLLTKLLNKGKYNYDYSNELKDIKYVKSQI